MADHLTNLQNEQAKFANWDEKFAEVLKRIRGERSQAEMTRLLGLDNQSTYARYEQGRIPKGDVLYQLANRMNVTVEFLLTGKYGEDVGGRTIIREYAPAPIAKARTVQVVSWAHAGDAEEYEELPKEWQGEVATNCRDPQAFGLELRGDSMLPKYEQGDIAIVMPNHEARGGGLAVAKLRENGVCFKIFNEPHGKLFRLTSYNPAYLPIEREREGFHWIWPVFEVVRNVWR